MMKKMNCLVLMESMPTHSGLLKKKSQIQKRPLFCSLQTNTRHVGTYFNVFLMVIPDIVMTFKNDDIFLQFLTTFWTCRLLTHAV